jgi:hypothetical protein
LVDSERSREELEVELQRGTYFSMKILWEFQGVSILSIYPAVKISLDVTLHFRSNPT